MVNTRTLYHFEYCPFGMVMPGRKYTKSGGDYRFGFNGKEKDTEGMGGGGSTYDYGFRIYNPQLGKFLSVDPLTFEFPWNSTYAYAENDVVRNIDLDGGEKLNFMDAKIMGAPFDMQGLDDFMSVFHGVHLQFLTSQGNKVDVYLVFLKKSMLSNDNIKKQENLNSILPFPKELEFYGKYFRFISDEDAERLTNCFGESLIEGDVEDNSELRNLDYDHSLVEDDYNTNGLKDLFVAVYIQSISQVQNLLADNYVTININERQVGTIGVFRDEEGYASHVFEIIGTNENGEFIYSSNWANNGVDGSHLIGTWDNLQSYFEGVNQEDVEWKNAKQ